MMRGRLRGQALPAPARHDISERTVSAMDPRPIGVFDSGLGGLTALRELSALLPGEELIYFGDTGRVPYGGRSRETIIKYAREDVAFLRSFHPKAIVIACGTVSTAALDVLRAENDLPIFGVVGPAARAAARLTRSGRIGLIGTRASIRTGAYERAIAPLRTGAQVTALACPLFVPLVENGRFRPGDSVAETVAAEYLASLKAAEVDTLILGCTHYPLLRDVIGNFMGQDVTLVDVGACCAEYVARRLAQLDLLAPPERQGGHRLFVSDNTGDFAQLASLFLGEDVADAVTQADVAACPAS